MTTETLIGEGFEFAVYDAGDTVQIRRLADGNILKSITGADAADMKACITNIGNAEDLGISHEQTIDLLSMAA